MGLDLSVCVIEGGLRPDDTWWLAYERISFHRDYGLFGQIAERGRGEGPVVMSPNPLPERVRFVWYGDNGAEKVEEDPYGSPLTYVAPAAFKKINMEQVSDWNKAKVIYLQSLPADTAIVLYWH